MINKFDGKCKTCGANLPAGSWVLWTKGAGIFCNAACQLGYNPAAKPARSLTVKENGIYKLGGEVYRVKESKSSVAARKYAVEHGQTEPAPRFYAERLVVIGGNRLNEADDTVKVDYVYAQGAIYNLTPDMLMPLDEAKAFGIRYGICIVCGRKLKDAKSVANGIGPICETYAE